MRIGVPAEIKVQEYRVGMTPGGVRELVSRGHEVLVQSCAGIGAGMTDTSYREAGAKIVNKSEVVYREADLIVKIKEPQLSECAQLQSGQSIFTYLHLAAFSTITEALIESGACCIAYETVTDRGNKLPLLTPMSEIAGRMSIQAAARFLEKPQGGRGVLLSGVPGVKPASVLIIGGGVVGQNAAKIAVGLGADVTILDRAGTNMRSIEALFDGRVKTLYSSQQVIEEELPCADVVIGAVLVAGASAPKLVSRKMLKSMKPGAVIVDVAIDQGGCFETSRPTTHDEPVFEVDGILHYCVANMPGAVPNTSTVALTSVTLPHIIEMAEKGIVDALHTNEDLRNGLALYKGLVTCRGVASAHGKNWVDPLSALAS